MLKWLLTTIVYLLQWLWLYDLNRLEIGFCLLALGAALAGWRIDGATRLLSRLAARRNFAVISIGAAALLIRAAILPFAPIPAPFITDEFSHLLVADTLASGRLTNPPHPMWRHFESIHVLEQPSHASMYFPAQGALLALGKVIFGHAWWGVWLSNGLMCAALCWMLQQWLPLGWALFGAVIALLRFSVFSYWNDSYWGGAVPALGGALVIGAVARIRRSPSFADGVTFGLGAAILLFSRPYEGCALCAAGLILCRKQRFSRAAMASGAVLVLASVGLSYYCSRVTGNPLRLPYQVNQAAYGWPMTLLWYQPHGIETPHKELRDYYNWELSEHTRFLPDSIIMKGQHLWGFFIGPCLTIPIFFLRWGGRIRPLLILGGAVVGAVLLEQTGYPHYFAPATGAFLALIVQGVRHLKQTRRGYAFAQFIPLILVATLIVRSIAAPIGLRYTTMARVISWCCIEENAKLGRAALKAKLENLPGQHLVIVHYGPKHSFAREWIYNEPEIDAAKVVWARDMGDANQELKNYFSGRRVWEIEVNDPI